LLYAVIVQILTKEAEVRLVKIAKRAKLAAELQVSEMERSTVVATLLCPAPVTPTDSASLCEHLSDDFAPLLSRTPRHGMCSFPLFALHTAATARAGLV
jgi:hypothetical protein